MSRRAFSVAFVAAIALAVGSLGSATAATIQAHSNAGWLGTFSLVNDGGDNLTLTFTNPTDQELDLINGSPVSIGAAFSTPIVFTATPTAGTRDFNIVSGVETNTFSSGSGAVDQSFVLDSGQAGDANNEDGLILTGVITDGANSILTVGDDSYDFSPLLGGVVTFALTGANYANASSMFDVMTTSGASVTGTAVFSQAAIPEPTSVALLGIGLGGLIAFRRRFAKRVGPA